MALLGLGRTLGETGRRAGAATVLRRARALALKKNHPYEVSLSRMEMGRLKGVPPSLGLFRPFEIPASIPRRWMDLP